jgi:hypothetical protein
MGAIIHLQKQSRHVNGRIGEFFRPDTGKAPHPLAEGLHIWQNKVLTDEEFNAEFPKAVKRMQDSGHVFGLILPSAASVEQTDALESLKAAHATEIEELKKKHAEEITLIQEGVNEFTEKHNAELAELRTALETIQADKSEAEAPASSDDKPDDSLVGEGSGASPSLVEKEAPAPSGPEASSPDTEAPKPKGKKGGKSAN